MPITQHHHRTLLAGFSSAVVAVALPLGGIASASASTGSHHHHWHHHHLSRSHAALSKQDRTFLSDSAEGDRFEVLGGGLARTTGVRQDVQSFGERMMSDHTQEYADTVHTAARFGLAVPTEPSDGQRAVLSLWGSMSGASFDCAYITYEWEDHQLDIADAKDEIENGHNGAVIREARHSLPTLREHLRLATGILRGLGRC